MSNTNQQKQINEAIHNTITLGGACSIREIISEFISTNPEYNTEKLDTITIELMREIDVTINGMIKNDILKTVSGLNRGVETYFDRVK